MGAGPRRYSASIEACAIFPYAFLNMSLFRTVICDVTTYDGYCIFVRPVCWRLLLAVGVAVMRGVRRSAGRGTNPAENRFPARASR